MFKKKGEFILSLNMHLLFLHLTPSQIKTLETEHSVSINKKTTSAPYNYYLKIVDNKIFKKIQNVLEGNATTYKYKDTSVIPESLPALINLELLTRT